MASRLDLCSTLLFNLLQNLPHKCISLVLEDAYFLDGTEWRERLLQDLFAESAGQSATDSAAVNGTVGWTALVVNLVEGKRFGVHCNWKMVLSSC